MDVAQWNNTTMASLKQKLKNLQYTLTFQKGKISRQKQIGIIADVRQYIRHLETVIQEQLGEIPQQIDKTDEE